MSIILLYMWARNVTVLTLGGRHHVMLFRPKLGVDYYVHEGEPTNDKERPHPVNYKELNFKISTPELVALGW